MLRMIGYFSYDFAIRAHCFDYCARVHKMYMLFHSLIARYSCLFNRLSMNAYKAMDGNASLISCGFKYHFCVDKAQNAGM